MVLRDDVRRIMRTMFYAFDVMEERSWEVGMGG